MADTSAPVRGTITTGVFQNRDNVTFPDVEQEKRAQARQESEWASGDRADHPAFTKIGPDKHFSDAGVTVPTSNRDRATAETDGTN